MRRNTLFALTISIFMLPAAAMAESATPEAMTDSELAGITAMGLDATPGVTPGSLAFNFDGAANGLPGLNLQGDAQILGAPVAQQATGLTNNAVILQDSAQNNLRSLVNVNAAGSVVQVLLNLNVNINSTVANLQQTNAAGLLPRSF